MSQPSIRAVFAVAAILAASTLPLSAMQGGAAPASPEIQKARVYTKDFYKGELSRLYSSFSPQFKESMSLDELRRFRRQVSLQFGVEKEVLGEQIIEQGEFRIYVRKARFDSFDGDVEVVVALRANHTIAGFSLRSAAAGAGS